jgi:cytoskeleton protein RodZ
MTFAELGQEIRARREEAGLTIDDVAKRVKVSSRILQAIEAGSLEMLPHTVYTKAFTRSFALMVGFPPEDIGARLEEIFPLSSFLDDSANAKSIARLHTPPPSRLRIKILALLLVLCLLAGIGGGIYYVLTRHGAVIWDFVKQPFSAISTQNTLAVSRQDSSPAAQYGGAPVALADSLPAAGQPLAPTPEIGGSAAPAAEENSSPSAVSAPAPDGNPSSPVASPEASAAANATARIPVPAAKGGLQRVEIQAAQECWIRFRVDQGRNRDHFTLLPGQSRSFSFRDSLEIQLGNAGGVRILYNNNDMGKLGRPGEVKFVHFPPDAPAGADGQ